MWYQFLSPNSALKARKHISQKIKLFFKPYFILSSHKQTTAKTAYFHSYFFESLFLLSNTLHINTCIQEKCIFVLWTKAIPGPIKARPFQARPGLLSSKWDKSEASASCQTAGLSGSTSGLNYVCLSQTATLTLSPSHPPPCTAIIPMPTSLSPCHYSP